MWSTWSCNCDTMSMVDTKQRCEACFEASFEVRFFLFKTQNHFLSTTQTKWCWCQH